MSLYVRVWKYRDAVLHCIGTSVSDVRSFDDYRIPFVRSCREEKWGWKKRNIDKTRVSKTWRAILLNFS